MAEGQILRWSGYEHEYTERGSDWFFALAIVAGSLAVVAVLFHNVLFAILILLGATVIGMLANVPPDVTEFEVSDRGIRVGKDLHRYDEILAFWVEDEHEAAPILLVDTVKFMSPNIVIPLDHEDIDPAVLRSFLREHSTEIPMREPRAHKILEFFGF
jgi:hypothetical protein